MEQKARATDCLRRLPPCTFEVPHGLPLTVEQQITDARAIGCRDKPGLPPPSQYLPNRWGDGQRTSPPILRKFWTQPHYSVDLIYIPPGQCQNFAATPATSVGKVRHVIDWCG